MIEFLRNIGILEAKTNLPEICSEVSASGETVIISRRGEPLVEVRPITKTARITAQLEVEVEQRDEDILKRRAHCSIRFGELEEEFVIPTWSAPNRMTTRNPFTDYWTQPRS